MSLQTEFEDTPFPMELTLSETAIKRAVEAELKCSVTRVGIDPTGSGVFFDQGSGPVPDSATVLVSYDLADGTIGVLRFTVFIYVEQDGIRLHFEAQKPSRTPAN
jgi:hypothetical protein